MNWPRIRRCFAFTLVGACAAFVAVAWFVGGALVAPAQHALGPPPSKLPIESISISSDSGATLAAWYLPAEDAVATVILLHPIRGDRLSMLGRAELLHGRGYSTLLVDLQAHGESSGEQITAGHRERHDVVAAVNYVRSRTPGRRVGIVGCSLGGAAALLAPPLEIDALVLEAVYPTLTEAVHNRVAMRFGALHHVLAPALLMQLKPRLGISASELRPIDHIAGIACPVLIAAGERDRRTTLSETKRLYDAANQPKQLVVFEDAAHVDLLSHSPVLYQEKIVGFLDQHLRGSAAPDNK